MQTERKSDTSKSRSSPIKRRTFLGLGLSGVAGLSLSEFPKVNAQAAGEKPKPQSVPAIQAPKANTYWDRTDRFEEKMKLLEAAWQRKDFRLARALAHSLRSTAIQAQAEAESPGTPLLAAAQFGTVASLPSAWRNWAQGWKHFKALTLDETIGQERTREPVEVLLNFPAEQVTFLARELRVARVTDGTLTEVPCQVHGEVRRGNERLARLLFMANSPAREPQTFLVLYGNPDAELPAYPTDLVTTGEGFGLDIENQFFKASLSRQMGQLERLTLKREHGL